MPMQELLPPPLPALPAVRRPKSGQSTPVQQRIDIRLVRFHVVAVPPAELDDDPSTARKFSSFPPNSI